MTESTNSLIRGAHAAQQVCKNTANDLTTEETNALGLSIISIVAGIGAMAVTALTALRVVQLTDAMVILTAFLAIFGYSQWPTSETTDAKKEKLKEQFQYDYQYLAFDQVVSKYGWQKILTNELPKPDEFKRLYCQVADGKTLNQIFELYEGVSSLSDRSIYTVPQPVKWATKWREETRDLTLEQILTRYNLEKVQYYSILDSGELSMLKRLSQTYLSATA